MLLGRWRRWRRAIGLCLRFDAALHGRQVEWREDSELTKNDFGFSQSNFTSFLPRESVSTQSDPTFV
jgi:hypothetical protein